MRAPKPLNDFQSKLATPLINWSSRDVWTLADACEGTFITGGTGSGKTSGSGANIAHSFLAAGFGGLVLTVKPEEKELWQSYCAKHKRSHHLFILDENNSHKFNFLNYELARSGRGSSANNAVNVLLEIMKMANGEAAQSVEDSDFWNKSIRQLLIYTITLLYHSHGHIDFPDIMRCINSSSMNEIKMIQDNEERARKFEQWKSESFFHKSYKKLLSKPSIFLDEIDKEAIFNYFHDDFGNLDNKPRSSIIATLTSTIQPFLMGEFRKIFATSTTLAPEMCRDGVIILLDLPVHQFGEFGRLAQVAFKYVWQNAMLRQQNKKSCRPVFLWADEAQYFFTDNDIKFQSTARQAKACTVYLTQNISGLRHTLNIGNSVDAVNSILGNFQTKIFHQNADPETQKYGAELIGHKLHKRYSMSEGSNLGYGGQSASQGGLNLGANDSLSFQEQMDWTVRPEEFARLQQGGSGTTEAIIIRSGKKFRHSGDIWLKTKIRQM